MRRQLFLSAGNTKSIAMIFIVGLGLVALMGSSCDPKPRSGSASGQSPIEVTEAQNNIDVNGIEPIVDAICQGDFEQAKQMLNNAPVNKQTQTLNELLDKHEQIELRRDQKRQTAFEGQLAELETIKEHSRNSRWAIRKIAQKVLKG